MQFEQHLCAVPARAVLWPLPRDLLAEALCVLPSTPALVAGPGNVGYAYAFGHGLEFGYTAQAHTLTPPDDMGPIRRLKDELDKVRARSLCAFVVCMC